MKKKILSIILTVIMLILPLSAASFAAEPVTLSLTSEKVYAGDGFNLNLTVSDNSKMSGAVIDISYDNTKLQFVSSEYGAILNKSANVSIKDNGNAIRFTYLDPSASVTAAGVLVKLRFKAMDNADGKTSLKISVPNAADFVTLDLDRISYKAVNSTVEIINSTYVPSESTETTTEQPTATTDVRTTVTETATESVQPEEKSGKPWFAFAVISAGLLVIGGAVALVILGKKREDK